MSELSPEQIERYLDRIGMSGPLPPTAETLAAVQWSHLHTIPFENLDICPLGTPISLGLQDIYEKIVSRRRGGYCFELNPLYAALLRGLGFRVALFGGHFMDDDGARNFFDHVTLHVTVPADGTVWYADVAAGRANPERPIPVGGVSVDGLRRVRRGPDTWLLDARDQEGAWSPVLEWLAVERDAAEFAERCAAFENDPESYFRQGALVTIMRPAGRVTLAKRTLITTVDNLREECELASTAEIEAVLRGMFGIEMPVDDRWR